MSARLIHQSNRGSTVVYDDGTEVSVESPRILAAKLALMAAATHCPTELEWDVWQTTVMQPLRDEIRDAIQARADELLETK